jgi:hypothetical protein
MRWMSSQHETYLAAGDTNLHGSPFTEWYMQRPT